MPYPTAWSYRALKADVANEGGAICFIDDMEVEATVMELVKK